MRTIVIATIKRWNLSNARALRKKLAGKWRVRIVSKPASLTARMLERLAPRYVFFPHWSWMIPEEIYSTHECVVFHMTDLPFGRGGSPLQNLLARGIRRTKVSALRAGNGADTGPVYFKRPLDLSDGSADEMLSAASGVVFNEMIPELLRRQPAPKPQRGRPVLFSRRKPRDSDIAVAGLETPAALYDFIRMLDGEGYPAAFLSAGGFRFEFRRAVKDGDIVRGVFEVKKDERK